MTDSSICPSNALLIDPCTQQRPAFFAVRIFLAAISSVCESFLYRTVVDKVNYRAGRYLFFFLLFGAGMWNASVAFLPSSFAMYFNTVAFAVSMEPTTSRNKRRTMLATLAYAAGALVGWPFSIAVAVPFVFEELFLYGGDTVSPQARFGWQVARWGRLIVCGLVAALLLVRTSALTDRVLMNSCTCLGMSDPCGSHRHPLLW